MYNNSRWKPEGCPHLNLSIDSGHLLVTIVTFVGNKLIPVVYVATPRDISRPVY